MATCTTCSCGETANETELLKRLDEAIAEHRQQHGGLIPVLQIAQGLFGHLPEAAIKRICTGLDKPYSEVAGVISFYHFFSTVPRGRHTIRICLGTACYVRGAKGVLASLQQELGIAVGGTTADRRFSLEVARCLGACGIAPACMVNDDIHQSMKPNKVAMMLKQYE